MKKWWRKKQQKQSDASEFLGHLQIFSLCQDVVIGKAINMHQTFLKIFPWTQENKSSIGREPQVLTYNFINTRSIENIIMNDFPYEKFDRKLQNHI